MGVETNDGFFTATVRRPLITCGLGDRSIARVEDEWGEHQHRVLYASAEGQQIRTRLGIRAALVRSPAGIWRCTEKCLEHPNVH